MQLKVQAVQTFFAEFYSRSMTNGMGYFTDSRRHWSERLWWILAFVLSVCLCGTSIQNIWTKWQESPVVLRFTEKEAPISAIPFPTVTICPETKASKDKLDVFSTYHAIKERSMNLSRIELTRMEAFVHTCQFHPQDAIHFGQDFMNESVYDLIQDMAPTFNDTIDECEWLDEVHPCSHLFKPILTAEGLCFSFNALNSHEFYTDEMAPEMKMITDNPNTTQWSFEHGYEDKVFDNDYPIRVFNARQSAVLIVQPRLFKRDLEYLCRGSIQGFKVILTAPGESMKIARDFLRVPLLEQADIFVRPKLVSTSEELRVYSPDQRKCYFNSERPLRFYKIYTQYTCEAECLANYTKIQCGCVKFSMPRANDTRICGAASVRCYQAAEKNLYGEDVIDGLRDSSARSFREKCNCLPACTSIEYDADIDRARFDFVQSLTSFKVSLDKYSGMKPSLLSISFKNHLVMTLKRSAAYTYTDFLAVCGGLFGLFLGVSALNIIEFVYYSLFRLFCALRKMKSENVVAPSKS